MLNAQEFKDFNTSSRNYEFVNMVNYMVKTTGAIAAMFHAYQKVDYAQRNLDLANQNLAQAYANIPWTMDRIVQDINSNVALGECIRSTGDWLIQRVQEIRSTDFIS